MIYLVTIFIKISHSNRIKDEIHLMRIIKWDII